MAGEILKALRSGDADALAQMAREHEEDLARRFEAGKGTLPEIGLSLEKFSNVCLVVAARSAKNDKSFGGSLKRLLRGPDVVLCVGIREGDVATLAFAGAAMKDLLTDRWELSNRAYPGIQFDFESFNQSVLTSASEICLHRDITLTEAIEKRMRFPDSYLSAAVVSSDGGVAKRARDAFSKAYYDLARSYLKKRWSTVPQAEECLNSLFFCALFEHTLSEKTGNPSKDETKRPPLLTEYHGQGPLAAWLTLTLGNMIRDSLRTTKATLSIDERVEMESDGSSLSRIELAVAEDQREGIDRSRCIQVLRSGLDGAWEQLKPREQLSLVLQTLIGLPPSVIARRIFSVHEGTITKYTTNGLTKIRDALREYAAVQGKLSPQEIDVCFQFIRDAFGETDTLAGGLVSAASAGNKD